MSLKRLLLCSLLCISIPVYAEEDAESENLMTEMAAKMAQMKARLRAYEADVEYTNDDAYAFSPFDTTGCDINIGNVIVDDGADSPDEVIVLIDGDVIQSNNCR
ncbi:hypothetical protein Thini_2982 [Thiothrix nivea DSM 5205]|uniref:Uncharacterized protein n=2 Tax=Thiothrix nivea TaxID=1031 RepID=A0A656HF06_THINJ|nr:hypothetical protein Thini_2982 [Thiothrix nivea DSM 5205]